MKKKPEITAYLKPSCGWSNGVRAIFSKYEIEYEEKDIINYPENRREMEEKSGQQLSPCVVVDGKMLADVSGKEVEDYLIAEGYIARDETPVGVPTDSSCSSRKMA